VGRWRVEHFGELDSTNRYVLDAARAGAADGLVAVADVQTAGRGRLDRTWQAPPGSSLLVSALVRTPGDAGPVVMAAAVALAGAVDRVAGVPAMLKWPNDLVVDDRKLAGLLAERDGDTLVVGAGCNVNWERFPEDLAGSATSCNLEAGHPVDRDQLLVAFLDGFAAVLEQGGGVVDEYRARLETLGRRVRVEPVLGDPLLGTAVDITDDGMLVVRDDAGTYHAVATADVVHLR
jgi:BirA family transcriptional regulator, biotin operon repressor / biotin---[acetyl-CoA-carboxylase] ligase